MQRVHSSPMAAPQKRQSLGLGARARRCCSAQPHQLPPAAAPALSSAHLHSSTASQRLGTTLGDEHMGPLPQPRGCPIIPKRTGLEPACVQDRALTGLQCPSALPRRGKQVLRALHDGHQQEPPQGSRVPALLTALQGPRGPARAGLGHTRADGARPIASTRSPGRPKLLFLIGIIYKCVGFLVLLF